MIENRELTMDDYLAMLRRKAKVILIPALVAPLAGWAVSYAFPPKYTSQSLVMIEGQRVPENMVQPLVSEDLTTRLTTLSQQVSSRTDLRPVLERVLPNKSSQERDAIIDGIQQQPFVALVQDLSQVGSTAAGGTAAKRRPGSSPVPGFNVTYTAPDPKEAQEICEALTSLIIEENLKFIQASAKGTADVLNQGLEDAKARLDDLDGKMADFKKRYTGQLPGDEENNLKILMGLNSQLEANTQTLNRAQQDKAYTESLLAQQLSAWKSLESTTDPKTLEKQLSDLQAQLLQLQARYTDDHPDVIKAKADIEEVKKKLAEINNASTQANDSASDTASASEPAEIRQLRLQVHQYSDVIAAATRDQKRLQQDIAVYQGRVAISPAVEEQYKQLSRDYANAQKDYEDLLANKSKADLTVKMNNQSQGERMVELEAANLPDSPSFPNRLLFAGGGLGAGLALGLGLALWLEFRDNSIRNEADAEAALELPMLAAIPWVGETEESSNGKGRFWKKKQPDEDKETAAV
jgi:uncharacterized protein involved in exopolysaccharide biosynthesis